MAITSQSSELELLEKLFHEHIRAVYNVAFRVLFNRADAEDIVQQTFIKAYQKLSTLRKIESARAWLLQIAYRDSISLIRKNREVSIDPNTIAEPQEALSDDPAEAILSNELAGQIEATLAEMKPDERIAVVLRDIEGLPMNQVANVLNINLSAAKMRVHRGRQFLRVALERNL